MKQCEYCGAGLREDGECEYCWKDARCMMSILCDGGTLTEAGKKLVRALPEKVKMKWAAYRKGTVTI
ncbi:MAG: hypothetical protein NUV49_01050 [Patescibacteria group bacterium]|nr:hypothetical protein [Patescibacteria group bacterium]